MIALPGGSFRMGSNRHYPEERPARLIDVAPFSIDPAPVTNAAFAAFVAATGYVTLAERTPRPGDVPDVDPTTLVPGSVVFTPPDADTPPRGSAAWWRFQPGVNWRIPQDDGRPAEPSHPVVHVAREDAEAFAAWCGKSLPTETEWEFAARGGLEAAEYAWGDEFRPHGISRANTWHGRFPFERGDEWRRTSPIRAFPPNGFGLFDMVGNVWEWTTTPWQTRPTGRACCTRAATGDGSFTIKGGSHLCAPSYCRRYRPAARQPHPAREATSHLGFRCVHRP